MAQGVATVHDLLGELDETNSLGRVDRPGQVVVSCISVAAQAVELRACKGCVRVPSVHQAKTEILVGAFLPGNAEAQVVEERSGDVKGRVVCPADGRAPLSFFGPGGQSPGQRE